MEGAELSQYDFIPHYEHIQNIKETIDQLMEHPKGLLSTDESNYYIGVKFQDINIENTEENRRLYRQMLYQAETSEYLSGVVMNHETFYQRNDDAVRFTTWLDDIGIIFGIRLDTGIHKLYKGSTEFLTEGLDNISDRLAIYRNEGCRVAKWRTIYVVSETKPSTYCIEENLHFMSRFAAVAQAQGIVPILTIELDPDGTYNIDWSRRVIEKILLNLLATLNDYNVCIEGILIEVNMIRPGDKCEYVYTEEQIAKATIETFKRTLPPAIPGILLKSGGESEEQTTIIFQEIVNPMDEVLPWRISFNFGSALQESALRAWMGKADNVLKAQEELRKRAEANSLALQANYEPGSVVGMASIEKLSRNAKYITEESVVSTYEESIVSSFQKSVLSTFQKSIVN